MFRLTIDGEVARLRLDRPEARNAVPLHGWRQLAEAVHEAEASSARVLFVSGEPGGAFCSGADIAGFDAFAHDEGSRTDFRPAIRAGLDALRQTALPTIALVEGACYGAGVALAMACDVRIAGEGALFSCPPARLGIAYPQEDIHRLVTLVGPGQAARLLYAAVTLDAAEALRLRLVEQDGGPAAAEALAAAMVGCDAESIQVLKRGVALAAAGIVRDEQQDRDFDRLLGSKALAERLAARRERKR